MNSRLKVRGCKDKGEIGGRRYTGNCDVRIMFLFPHYHCPTRALGGSQGKIRVIDVWGIERTIIFSLELLHFNGQVTLEYLWFTKINKVREIMVLNEVQQIIFVSPKSLYIPDY